MIRTALFCAAALGAAVPVLAAGWTGDTNVLLAGKRLDGGDWGPGERQGELGIQVNAQPPDWPVALAADFLASGRDAPIESGGFDEVRARTTELDLGARKIWKTGPHARPYLGAGLAIVSGDLEFRGPNGSVSDHDNGAGLWLGGGIFWTLESVFNIGVDAKLTGASVRLFEQDRNAGGFHLGVLLGYHWGGP